MKKDVGVDLLADLVLIFHFLYVLFVVAGLAAIWAGYFLNWVFVRDLRFRLAHLGAIGFVVAESLMGAACPLTVWEGQLRSADGGAYQGTFLQHWMHRVLFYQIDEKIFTVLYVVFFVLVVLSFGVVKPRWSRTGKDRPLRPPFRFTSRSGSARPRRPRRN